MSRAPLVFGIMQEEISEYNDYKSKVRVDVEIVSDQTFPTSDNLKYPDIIPGEFAPTTTKLDFYISGKDDKEWYGKRTENICNNPQTGSKYTCGYYTTMGSWYIRRYDNQKMHGDS